MRTLVLGATCAVLVACGQRSGGGSAALVSSEDSLNYVVGYQIGTSLKQQGIPAPKEAIMLRAMREALAGTRPTLTEEQARAIVMGFQQRRMEAASMETDKLLADNAKKADVKTTASGLQWKVVREGKGPRPKPTSSVTVHYRGTLLNGTAFDSSYGGAPVTFSLNGVIPGWAEAVQLMPAGAKYQFWLPAKLAYGERGSPPMIGPNQALMFEIELLSFK